MSKSDQGMGQLYKVKLASGRILGPFGLDPIRRLILKNQIRGQELARRYPEEDWRDINSVSEIADLLIAHASGRLAQQESLPEPPAYQPLLGTQAELRKPVAETQILENEVQGEVQEAVQEEVQKADQEAELAVEPEVHAPVDAQSQSQIPSFRLDQQEGEPSGLSPNSEADSERTMVGLGEEARPLDEDRTSMVESEDRIEFDAPVEESSLGTPEVNSFLELSTPRSQEQTIVLSRPVQSLSQNSNSSRRRNPARRAILMALFVMGLGYTLFFDESPPPKKEVQIEFLRPKLPPVNPAAADPKLSSQVYGEGMKFYIQDTALGYRQAAEHFSRAVSLDSGNVKALALLASSYINLIDSTNKDENYFSVLTTLIEMSRAKSVDLPETVIADVEFFLMVNKPEAAQQRLVDYTKTHPSFGVELFYYLSLAFYARGDHESAAKYLALIPEQKAFSAKIFYLRAELAEAFGHVNQAIQEYHKAIQLNPNHAKSRLKIARFYRDNARLLDAKPHLEFLVSHLKLLSPHDQAQVYFLHSQLSSIEQKSRMALEDMEKAVVLDPENHDFLLELYALRAKNGESNQDFQKIAKMYYFLGEGEKLVKKGQFQDALIPFLQARSVNDSSPLPLIKMGDMFSYLNHIENAKVNYKLAADRATNDIAIWSKYIRTLIQSYEWDEAIAAMDRFRKLPVSQSALDKAAADMYQKQGNFIEAQRFYKKAMARDSIESSVYEAYAKSLMATKNFKDAPFFFSLALRSDPLNLDIKIHIAQCISETDSIDRAISMLEDENKHQKTPRAELLAAIAELQMKKGSWEEAKFNISEAMRINPDYPESWRLQAQIYLNSEGSDRNALNQALAAYQSFSERNTSDPSGYLERYKIFAKKAQFEKAKEELDHIYLIYPKYPNLHYYLGALYALQGNHKVAAEEFKKELQNNPNSQQTLLAYGKELMELGAHSEALVVFTKLMQLSPRSAEAKQQAGWANLALKNYQASVSLILSAIDLDRANPLLYKRLGLAYRTMGDFNAACASFRKYLEMEPDATDKGDFLSCF
ncbi:MAG: tetratricopeptide repeat protein [Bdellovibrionia bacterium]